MGNALRYLWIGFLVLAIVIDHAFYTPIALTVLALIFAIASLQHRKLIFASFAMVALEIMVDKYRWHGGWH